MAIMDTTDITMATTIPFQQGYEKTFKFAQENC